MTADGQDSVAVVHMTNAYGAGLADAFVANMDASHVCTQVGYEETTTDFSTMAQAVVDAGCTSVFYWCPTPPTALESSRNCQVLDSQAPFTALTA